MAGIVAVATVALSVANLIFLWINGKASRRHELEVLRETRRQQRLDATYRELVTLMHHVQAMVDLILAGVGFPPEDNISSLDVSKVIAQVKTFASTTVIQATDQWATIQSSLAQATAEDNVPVMRSTLAELRLQERVVVDAIRDELY